MGRFSGETTWITGASSGIGRALALRMADEGGRLLLSGRREDALREVARACGGEARAAVLPFDLAEVDRLGERVAAARELVGPIDRIVHSGGVSQRSLAVETELSVDRRLMEVDYFGTVALTKELLPGMLERGRGHVVVVSSVLGLIHAPQRSGYSAAKHALHGYFGALRSELHGSGVDITVICPGYVHTDVSRNALTADGSPQGTMDRATRGGLDVDDCARAMARAIARRREEVVIAGPKEHFAVVVHRLWPQLFRYLIRRVAST